MTLFGLVLVLAAAVCHATWNFFAKKIASGAELLWLFSVFSSIIYLPFAAWSFLSEQPIFDFRQVGFILGSVALHLSYFLLLQRGYRRGDLSFVYPTARASGPLLSTGLAVLFLKENISMQIAVGALVIIIGIFCLTVNFGGKSKKIATALPSGLGAGVFIGSYTVWDAYAVSALLIPPLLLDYASNVGRVILLTPIATRKWQTVRKHWQEHRLGVVVIAVFSPLAYILVLYAMTFTPVVYVAALRETSVLLSVIAGSLLLREGSVRHRLGWGTLIFFGVVLLVGG